MLRFVLAALAVAIFASIPHTVTVAEEPTEFDTYQLVLLKRPESPTEYPDDELHEIQRDHLAYMGEMAKAGHLVVAGPFADQEHPNLRGLALYRVESIEEARRLAAADPAVQAGRLEVEIMTWYTEQGALAFPLAESMFEGE